MPILIPITLKCDFSVALVGEEPECKAICTVTAPLTGKVLSKARVDLTGATEPSGWSFRLEEEHGYGTRSAPEMRCYCPEHGKVTR